MGLVFLLPIAAFLLFSARLGGLFESGLELRKRGFAVVVGVDVLQRDPAFLVPLLLLLPGLALAREPVDRRHQLRHLRLAVVVGVDVLQTDRGLLVLALPL